MADLPTVNAIEELKISNREGFAKLDKSIVSGLSGIKLTSNKMASSLASLLDLNKKLFEQDKINQLKLIEQMREDARKKKDGGKDKSKEVKEAEGALSNLLSVLKGGGLLAGATVFAGLAAAIAGYRGWETKAIKNLSKIKSLPDSITKGFKTLRADFMRGFFGLDPDGKPLKKPATPKVPLFTQIGNVLEDWKKSAFRSIGLGVDGKPVVDTKPGVKKGYSVVQSIKTWASETVDKLKNSFANIFTRIKNFFSGKGSFVVKAMASVGKALRAIPVVGQIIGFVISLFEGIFAAWKEEGTWKDKLHAGVAASVGSFIGAPMDLLKSILSWIVGKLGFKDAEKFLDSFSIQDELTAFLRHPIDYIMNIIDWMASFFRSDVTNELKDAEKEQKKLNYEIKTNRAKLMKARAEGNQEEVARLEAREKDLHMQRSKNSDRLTKAQGAFDKQEAEPSILEKMMDWSPEEFLKNILRSVLPVGDSLMTKSLQAVIPDALYEYANLDKVTGEIIKAAEVKGVEGAEVDVRSREVEAGKASAPVNVVNAPTSVNNNTTSRTNNVSVAPAGAMRSRPTAIPSEYYDPTMVSP
jgi:hypothetical protein